MRIQLFGLGLESRSGYVTAKSMRNMYCERRPRGEKAQVVAYRTPGLAEFVDFGLSIPARGLHEFQTGNIAFCVIGNGLYEINGNGVTTFRGTLLTSSGRVSISDNGTQVMIVDGIYGYIYNTSTLVFVQITDVDFPANPLTVTFLAGRFLININSSGRFYCSDQYAGLSWNALNFANAESNPDPIVAVWASNGQAVLLGSVSMEFWGASGATDFAFAPIGGTATEWGLAAPWSVAKFDNSIAMLVKNRMGQVMVATLNGYLPKKISTPDIDNIINNYATVNDASAYSYMLGGHNMYVINFPSEPATWLYDGSTGMWTQLFSEGLDRHIGQFGISFLTYTLVADYETGMLYTLSGAALTDAGGQIQSEIVSETVVSPDYDRFTVDKLRVDVEVGQGTPTVPNPMIGLSVSRDNGKTWGAELMRPIGPVGQYGVSVEWTRLGTARNFVFRLRITDPVAVCIVNAVVNPKD